MSDRFVQAVRTADIADGGMKAAELDGREIVVCHCGGAFHAIDRRCGHMSAPLEMGTLDGTILTCPKHCAQFDVTMGDALSGPVPPYLGGEVPPPRTGAFLKNVEMLMQHVRTESVGTYETRVEAGWVMVAIPDGPKPVG